MRTQILDKTKKKKFIEKISYLGIKKIPYLLIKSGKERIRAYSGSLSSEEICKIQYLLPVEVIGLYLGKELSNGENGIRLSLDGLHVLKNQISKNIIEINQKQEEEWFLGRDIELTEKQQEEYKNLKEFVAIKSGEDFIGTGKISHDKSSVSCFLPKARRIKN